MTVGFGSGKYIKDLQFKIGTWNTSFATTNATFTDVTNATITITGLNPNLTYTIMAFVSTVCYMSAAPESYNLKILINGSQGSVTNSQSDGVNRPQSISLSGSVTGITGASSYIIKLQVQSDGANTVTVNPGSATHNIMALALEQ